MSNNGLVVAILVVVVFVGLYSSRRRFLFGVFMGHERDEQGLQN
jgi:hypothetical protein